MLEHLYFCVSFSWNRYHLVTVVRGSIDAYRLKVRFKQQSYRLIKSAPVAAYFCVIKSKLHIQATFS
jgi:hypothetical protein